MKFMKTLVEELADGLKCLRRVRPFGGDGQFGPLGGAESQQRQNAATIDLLGALVKEDFGLVTTGAANQQISRAGVEALAVEHANRALQWLGCHVGCVEIRSNACSDSPGGGRCRPGGDTKQGSGKA